MVRLIHLKTRANDWLPPALTRTLRAWRDGSLRFRGPFERWADAEADSVGYDSAALLQRTLTAHRAVMRGEAAFQRDGQTFSEYEPAWPVITALMWAGAQHRGDLSVLDIGGGLGTSYFQHRPFLGCLPIERWCIVEQPAVASAAASEMMAPIEYAEGVSAAVAGGTPDAIIVSSSLQYFSDPDALLGDIDSIAATTLVFDRTPLHNGPDHQLTVQQIPKVLGGGSYPCWILSRPRLEKLLTGWEPVSRTPSAEGEFSADGGLGFAFGAILFKRRD